MCYYYFFFVSHQNYVYKINNNFFRGILSMSWCSEDPNLLISCGKDNRLLIWNPSSETDVSTFFLIKNSFKTVEVFLNAQIVNFYHYNGLCILFSF